MFLGLFADRLGDSGIVADRPAMRSCLVEDIPPEDTPGLAGGITPAPRSCGPVERMELQPGEYRENALTNRVMLDGLYPDNWCQAWTLDTDATIHQVTD